MGSPIPQAVRREPFDDESDGALREHQTPGGARSPSVRTTPSGNRPARERRTESSPAGSRAPASPHQLPDDPSHDPPFTASPRRVSRSFYEAAVCGGPFVEVLLDTDDRTQAKEAVRGHIHAALMASDAIGEGGISLDTQLRSPGFWSNLPDQFKSAFTNASQPFFAPMRGVIQEKLLKPTRSKGSPKAMESFARKVFAAILPPVDRVFLVRGARDAAIRQVVRQAIERFPMQALQILRDVVEELWALNDFHDLSVSHKREVVRRCVVTCVVEFGAIAIARGALGSGQSRKIERIRRHVEAAFASGGAQARAESGTALEGMEDPVREDARGVLFIEGLLDEVMRGFVSLAEVPLVRSEVSSTVKPAAPAGDRPPT